MRTIFIPATSKAKINSKLIRDLSKELPKNIAITYSVQFEKNANAVREELSKNHNVVMFSQVLGCSKPIPPKETQGFVIISNGKFHATALAYESGLPVYILDHEKFQKITDADIEKLVVSNKVSYLKYLSADEVGVLVTTKPGQQRLKQAMEFKKSLKGKKSYIFLADNIDTKEFENFGLKSWVNTVCPRMDLVDSSIINISKIPRE